MFALRNDWGFRLETIRSPVLFWHGADDNFSPVSHTHWMADRVRHALVRVEPDVAHFGAVAMLPDLLSWLVTRPVPTAAGA